MDPSLESKLRPLKCEARLQVLGHVLNTDFEGSYNDWDKHPPADLFDAPIVKTESEPKQRVTAHLRSEARGADVLVRPQHSSNISSYERCT